MNGPKLDPDAMPPEELARLRAEGYGQLIGDRDTLRRMVDGGEQQCAVLVDRLNRATRLLCAVTGFLDLYGYPLAAVDPELPAWWEQHQREDRRRA